MATKPERHNSRKNKSLRRPNLRLGERSRLPSKSQWIAFFDDVETQTCEEWDEERQIERDIQAQWDEVHQAIRQNDAAHLDELLPPINLYCSQAKYWSNSFCRRKYVGGNDILVQAVDLQRSDCIDVILDKIYRGDLPPSMVNDAGRGHRVPLAIACERGDLDLVQKLVERGRANTSACQAFFIVFEQGNEALMSYLATRCDVRETDRHGQTALDRAIDAGYMETAKILLCHGDIERNRDGLSSMMLVAHHDLSPLVDLLFQRLPLQEAVDELVLLACHYTIAGDVQNRQKAFDFFVQGLNEEVLGEAGALCDAYECRRECRTLDQLVAIRNDENALRMHALLAGERILLRLGDTEPLLKLIERQCHVYRRNQSAHRSLQLRVHAHQLALHTEISRNLLLDWHADHFGELIEDLCRAWSETGIVPINSIEVIATWLFDENEHEHADLAHIFDLLATILYMTQSVTTQRHERRSLLAIARRAMRYDTMGHSLLIHYIRLYVCGSFIHSLPGDSVSTFSVIQWMIQCGANVNGVGSNGFFARPLYAIAAYSNSGVAKPIIELLLAHGAHADCIDSRGQLPQDLALQPDVKELLRPTRKLSLRCRCAQIIVSARINYRHCLPSHLLTFVRLHTNEKAN